MDTDLESTQGLYRDMFLARRLDAEALALQRQGELGLWLMSLGQEAAQVGSIRALRETDYVFPSYREHAAALARGIGPADLLRQWRGVAHAGLGPARLPVPLLLARAGHADAPCHRVRHGRARGTARTRS